ncbi:MAG: valine--tRNA ligase [Patescibacteria group bacterium]
MNEIPTRYDHAKEPDLYKSWEEAGEFKPTGNGEPFSMIIPPPNVTGDLHLGHGLTYAVHDTIARHQRRLGKDVLLLPGADHAAIAVQHLVEKKLQKDGVRRTEMGREKFLEEVWKWTNYYLPRIQASLRRFGLSADWSRFRFTMDEQSQKAVTEAFVRLHEQGLIYQGTYLINWDPKLQTAVSDDEVNYQQITGKLYWIKYGPISVATTRPETKLGDTAIAVNPIDQRYKKYVGQEIEFKNEQGAMQKLPVIADESVDPEFGTGALKVTPAHDPLDWELGQKHKLPSKQVIDQFGKISAEGPYAGLKTLEAREKIVADLEKLGLLEKVTEHNIRQPISERSGAIIEPLPSKQWFMKTTALKNEAAKAVQSGAIKFYPKNVEKIYFHWLENLHDWCISRQLWWGHHIPAWYCRNASGKGQVASSKEPVIAAQRPKKCPICGECEMVQDPDVLDTWFSAGIWPFSTLGWPLPRAKSRGSDDIASQQSDFTRYFPTSLLETGADILFFWVARMIMMSQALTKQIPFKEVYFHGLVLDDQGQKMSKSKGNVLDPLALIDKYGADAVRMSLIGGNSAGLPQRFSEQKVLKYRNFVTKIWNAARFTALSAGNSKLETLNSKSLDETEKKFIKRLDALEKDNPRLIAGYKLGVALEALYEFFWHDFADQLIEYEKKIIQESTDPGRVRQSQEFLMLVLKRQLTLLEDFAPFVVRTIKKEMLH